MILCNQEVRSMAVESKRKAEAYDLYFAMGEDRSYEAVAKAMGVSKNTIANWARMFNWQSRVAEREEATREKIYQEMYGDTDKVIIDANVKYRRFIEKSIDKYIKSFKDGAIKITSINEFIKLVELDLKLAGLTKDDLPNDESTHINFIIK